MKAVLCKEFGPPETLVVEEIAAPEPKAGEVVVDVAAASVNFPDVLMIENKYQATPSLPFSPGGEAAGVVAQLGDDVKGLAVGDRVIASCGTGGFVEKLAIRAEACTPMPEAMDFDAGAAMIMVYGTSYHALKDRAQLQSGETLLVMGAAGGVGLAAVDLGKAMGARVVAAASTEEKLAVCREHGADETLLYPTGELTRDQQRAFSEAIKEATGGGADVVYDPIGDAYAEPALRATNWGGRYLVIGFAAGAIPKIPLNLTLLKGSQIVGVFWGAFAARDPKGNAANNAELMTLYEEGKIRPHVSKRYPFEEAGQAIADMRDRKVTGKIVVVTS